MKTNKIEYAVIGGGLTGLTIGYYLKKANKNIHIFEKKNRVGGVIETKTENGFVYEAGPNTGVIGSPELVSLFDDLKPLIEIEVPKSEAKNRWIWKKGKWNNLPTGLISALSTPLFSWYDKIRILGEPFRKVGKNKDESITQMVRRRMGKSYLDYAVNPFISGIYAGNPETLITRFAMPKLYNLEQNYGSFIKGAIKKAKEPKSDLEKRVSREVFSIKGGLSQLILALSQEIGYENIKMNCKNIAIEKKEAYFILNYTDLEGKSIVFEVKNVIITVSGSNLPSIIPFVSEQKLKNITNARYARVIQVVLGYTHWKGLKLNAFGGLIPSHENRNVLGILFPSAIFPNRAPETGALLSVFMGGINNPDLILKSDEEIKVLIISEIEETLKSENIPDFIKIFRYFNAIPQYEISSAERFTAIDEIQNEYKGLWIAGNLRDGIGMADRVKQAKQLADSLTKNIKKD